jgi:purine nucleosidase
MTRKVIIDCDMGTDDAVGLCLALFSSQIDLLAVTACEGCVSSDQANNNLQAIIAQLDPPRWPRLGLSTPTDGAPPVTSTYLYGDDGLGNSNLPVSPLHHLHSSDKVIIDTVRAHPGDVTIVCLGPLTNIARAFQREPTLFGQVHRLIATGGCVQAPGNVTPAADFNFYFDPLSARRVLQSRVPISLIPLDATAEVQFGLDLLNDIPGDDSRVGHFLNQVIPPAFRTYRQQLGRETIVLNDAIGVLAVLQPELFKFDEMACDVETTGEITRGTTVFDRRIPPEWSMNVEVATSVQAQEARKAVSRLLKLAGEASSRNAE